MEQVAPLGTKKVVEERTIEQVAPLGMKEIAEEGMKEKWRALRNW